MEPERFRNRNEAGRLLAEKLTAYANRPDVLVLALPRGGVPVAYEVARALGAPLDVFVVRKLGIPGYEEYLKRQTADVGVADAGLAARRATQPIGTPDEIIEKIRALQHAISLDMVVIHFFYGGMPRKSG